MSGQPPHDATLLVADIGNTRVHLAGFSGDRLQRRTAFAVAELANLEQLWPQICEQLTADSWDAACLGAVHPPALQWLDDFLRPRVPTLLALGRDCSLSQVAVGSLPEGVGADRVANALAAWHFKKRACLVFDCGTALTCEAIDDQGNLLGGCIAPGIALGARVLAERTQLLPEVRWQSPPELLGRDTRGAIASGLLYGWRGLLQGLVRRFRAALGGLPVLLTGGDAEQLFEPGESLWGGPEPELAPDLTLHGVRLAFERWQRS